jgi:5-formyltetrahydrofolate cyclo-ligase
VPVDIIVTPTRVIRVRDRRPRPDGIIYELLSHKKVEEIPMLREIIKRKSAFRS